MSECCAPSKPVDAACAAPEKCPSCGAKGRKVDAVTLRSLLAPDALMRLVPEAEYRFCVEAACDTVYYAEGSGFEKTDVLVPVFQKDTGENVPVCYCFDYTRARLREETAEREKSDAVAVISRLVKEGKCACEFRNPQGSCCLGNVSQFLEILNPSQKETQS
jgi:hypothetical protein